MSYNSDHFDLTKWYLTLPVDSTGGTTGLALNIMNPTGYESSYFYDATDGAMVFYAPVLGATTSNSYGTRSELRELSPDGTLAKWNPATGGTMTATLSVDKIPTFLTGAPGKVIIGQIHGKSHELVRLYYDNGTVYFKNDVSGTTNSEHKFLLTDAAGNTPHIALGHKFSYLIDAHDSTLIVKVIVDGVTYSSVTDINSYWQTDTLYFKAGVYLGVTAIAGVDVGQGIGAGQTSFYGLDFGHTAGSGMGGLPSVFTPGAIDGTAGNDKIDADHDKDTAINGLGGNDTLIGHDGNDTLHGGDGADKLYGYWGNDILDGGTGNDMLSGGPGKSTFLFKAGDGADIITDFKAGDIIDLTGYKGVGSFSDLHFTKQGSDTLLSFGAEGSILLKGVAVSALSAANFHITGSVSDPVSTPGAVNGTASNDTLNADHDKGTALNGLAGNDTLIGHDGNDVLYGGDGADKLYGYWGDDVLVGGYGKDQLSGGPGNDIFRYTDANEGGDTIIDFHNVMGDRDTLDLTALFAANGLGGEGTATAVALGHLTLTQGADGLHIGFDRDGFAGAQASVHIATLTGNDAAHFDINAMLTGTGV